eukprot:XP_765309.1 hypothetical protein [Theileria parva strain Muguga]
MDFYKDEQVLSTSQKKKLKKKLKQYQEQLESEQRSNSEVDVGRQEYKLLQDKLQELGLKIHDIQPDGNCLFKSIEHQLKYYNENGYNLPKFDYMDLRRLAVDHLKKNQNEYENFLALSNTSNLYNFII